MTTTATVRPPTKCPRCKGALAPAADVGPNVYGCGCGCFFVTGPARERLLSWLRIEESIWWMILSQGRRGPECACGKTMQTGALKGVTVDGCPTCGSMLLDPGELRSLTGVAEPERATAPATSTAPISDASLGRVFVPARQAFDAFARASRSFHLLQAAGTVGGEIVGLPVNQPFQWTVQNGMSSATITPADDSMARQLLAFVTRNMVSSRFALSDGRDNPMLVFVRHTKALVNARVDVLWADDEVKLGEVSRSIVGFALDMKGAGGHEVLRFEKRVSEGDVWGFTVVDNAKRKVGEVRRGFGNVEADMSLLGGIGVERSVRRDDFELFLEENAAASLSIEQRALAIAATFLVAHVSNGPAGITALFND